MARKFVLMSYALIYDFRSCRDDMKVFTALKDAIYILKILSCLVFHRCSEIKLVKPHSHRADVATVHPDAGQLVYRDAPGHIS